MRASCPCRTISAVSPVTTNNWPTSGAPICRRREASKARAASGTGLKFCRSSSHRGGLTARLAAAAAIGRIHQARHRRAASTRSRSRGSPGRDRGQIGRYDQARKYPARDGGGRHNPDRGEHAQLGKSRKARENHAGQAEDEGDRRPARTPGGSAAEWRRPLRPACDGRWQTG